MSLNNLLSIYNGKKILVTGHTGFKGAWLTIILKQLGAEIIGLGLDPKSDNDVFNCSGIGAEMEDYRADIRDKEKLKEIIAKHKPEIVFHLAAQPLV